MTDHEQIVLGSMLIDPRILEDVFDLIPEGIYFKEPRHEWVFDAITAVYSKQQPMSAITVGDELLQSGMLEKVGGRSAIHALVNRVATSANATYCAMKVRDAYRLRQVALTGAKLTQLVEDSTAYDDAIEIVNRARVHLDSVITVDDDDVPNRVAVFQAIDALDEPPGPPTPWKKLTYLLSGWKPSCLYIIAARPAVGKSVLAAQAALDMARRGKTAMLFSLEMSKVELYHRLLCSVSEVPMEHIQARRLTPEQREQLKEAARHIASLPLIVSDESQISVAQIQARVCAVQRDTEVGLVVIDYLGLIQPGKGSGRDRRVDVDGISRGLKIMAKTLDVPVVAAAQLNRDCESRADKRPVMSDLRESGGQEADADAVILLHAEPDSLENLLVLVAKSRHGKRGHFDLNFRGRFSRADDYPNF